jgi:hypothetical protein
MPIRPLVLPKLNVCSFMYHWADLTRDAIEHDNHTQIRSHTDVFSEKFATNIGKLRHIQHIHKVGDIETQTDMLVSFNDKDSISLTFHNPSNEDGSAFPGATITKTVVNSGTGKYSNVGPTTHFCVGVVHPNNQQRYIYVREKITN